MDYCSDSSTVRPTQEEEVEDEEEEEEEEEDDGRRKIEDRYEGAEDELDDQFKQELQGAIAASLDDHAHQLQMKEVITFSDSLYASQLQLEEALIASSCMYVGSSSNPSPNCPDEYDQYPDYTQVGSIKHQISSPILVSLPKRPRRSEKEVTQGSQSPPSENLVSCGKEVAQANQSPPSENLVSCGICLEAKHLFEIFHRESCSHRFCHDCIAKHVLSKLQEKLVPISCPEPNCSENLMPEQCENVVPVETLDKWRLILVEAVIPESQRYYCPYKDCSALLLNDVPEIGTSAEAVIKQSECPVCRRLFCAQCEVAWHAGFKCDEFQRLSPSEREEGDLRLLMLAKEKEWQRCPKCRRVVEKESGCPHMTCRCGLHFCYKCGSEWKNTGVPCQCPGWEDD